MRAELRATGYSPSEVYVFGIDGDTADGILKRFDCEMKTPLYGIDTVIFAIGINDAVITKDGNVFCEESVFEQNMRALCTCARTYVTKIVIVGLTKVNESLVNPLPQSTNGKCYTNERIEKFNAILRTVATEEKCFFVENMHSVKERDLADGLHPNSKGHEKIFHNVLAVLKAKVL